MQKKGMDKNVLTMTHKQLANMCDHLCTEDLMKVVEKDECLLPAVAIVFKERHLVHTELTLTNKDGILLTNESLNKAIIEAVGAKVRKLHLIYDDEYRPFDMILEKFVEDNLTKSLTAIKLVNAGRHSLAITKKPFEKVTDLYFDGGTLFSLFSRFGRLFPNVTELSLKDLKIHNTESCEAFEKVNTFKIENIDGEIRRIATFIALNQLSYSSFRRQGNIAEFLALISKEKSRLPNLWLEIDLGTEYVGMEQVRFEQLHILYISGLEHKLNIHVQEMKGLFLNDAIIWGHWIELLKSAQKLEVLGINGEYESDSVAARYKEVLKKISENNLIYVNGFRLKD